VLNDPVNLLDPSGLDILLIRGGGIASNPAGHTAAAVEGQGVFSLGTPDHPLGSSATEYLEAQSSYRDQELTIIQTTPEQDAAFVAAFARAAADGFDLTGNNCADAVNQGLDAAGIPSSLGGALDSLPGTGGRRAQAESSRQNNGNPTTVRIGRGGSFRRSAFGRFNPR